MPKDDVAAPEGRPGPPDLDLAERRYRVSGQHGETRRSLATLAEAVRMLKGRTVLEVAQADLEHLKVGGHVQWEGTDHSGAWFVTRVI